MGKLDLFLTKAIMFQQKQEIEIVGGWVGDGIDNFVENFKKGLLAIVDWIVVGLINTLSPFVLWGCKAGIVICFIIYYVSQDKRAISNGLRLFFIFLIFAMIRGAVL